MRRASRNVGILAALLLSLGLLLALVVAASGQQTGPGAPQAAANANAAALVPAAANANTAALVPAADFVDDGFTARNFTYDEVGGYTYPISETYNCVQAAVYLPDGVTVSGFGGYVYDNDASGRLQYIELRRVAYGAGPASLSDLMARASTTADYAQDEVVFVAEDDPISHPTIDNSTYVYYTIVCMVGSAGDNLRLYAVEAAYSQ